MNEENQSNVLKLTPGAGMPIKVTGAEATRILEQQNEYQEHLESLEKKDVIVNNVNSTGFVLPTEVSNEQAKIIAENQVDQINNIAAENKNEKKDIIIMCIIIAVIVLLFLIFELPMILGD